MRMDNLLSISEDRLQCAVRLNLLRESRESLEPLRRKALGDSRIQCLLTDVADFHKHPVTGHKNPDLAVHKLLFLLDLGFGTEVPQIQTAVEEILRHRDDNGVCQTLMNVPKHFGGSGEDAFCWALCDAPWLLLALIKAGVDDGKYVRAGADHLAGLWRPGGFPCAVSKELGSFRGPGRKGDCCPYATLGMVKLLSHLPGYQTGDIVNGAALTLLDLWENSRIQHPYLFYMGTDFRKLKAPPVWYDLVSVAEVLSLVDSVKGDSRFLEMISLISSKQDKDGLFTPEAVYARSKGWDFGQKKIPSPYLTYVCLRILDRVNA